MQSSQWVLSRRIRGEDEIGSHQIGSFVLGLASPDDLLRVVAVDALGAELPPEVSNVDGNLGRGPSLQRGDHVQGALGVLLDGHLLEPGNLELLGIGGPGADGRL